MSLMRALLLDFTRHCIWADDEIWNAVTATPAALVDTTLLERFHHLHLVQHAFVHLVRGETVDARQGRGLDPDALREWGRAGAVTLFELARLIPDAELDEHIQIPWFRDPPIEISRGEALVQACLHTIHHRAQNATRLRELGGDPPNVDYIYWIWKGRPDPS
jgi:uncharacterized damage-inducible protein DinB